MGWTPDDKDIYDPDSDQDDGEGAAAAWRPVGLPNPLKWIKGGASVLSQLEADNMRPMLVEIVTGYTEYADTLISNTNRNRTKLTEEAGNLIWSDLDEDEIYTLVDGMLIIGRRQRHVAQAIREIARAYYALQAGIILLPRFMKTLRFYADNGGIALW